MASELSRLIDDELEKFERRPSANEQPNQKATFGVKSSQPKDAANALSAWRDRAWWSWKRVGSVLLISISILGALYILSKVGGSTSSTAVAGTNSAGVSQTGDFTGAGVLNGKGIETPREGTPPALEHNRNGASASQEANAMMAVADSPAPGLAQLSQGVTKASLPSAGQLTSGQTSESLSSAPVPSAYFKASQAVNQSPAAYGVTEPPLVALAVPPASKAAPVPITTVRFPGFGRKLLQN